MTWSILEVFDTSYTVYSLDDTDNDISSRIRVSVNLYKTDIDFMVCRSHFLAETSGAGTEIMASNVEDFQERFTDLEEANNCYSHQTIKAYTQVNKWALDKKAEREG